MFVDSSDGKVLIVRDCGFKEDQKCLPHEKQFSDEGNYEDLKLGVREYYYRGDDYYLRQKLQTGRYVMVALFSGGGHVTAGYKVGRVLKELQIDVTVPRGSGQESLYCISACTFAFLGGFVRKVDEGATFEVHSASARGYLEPNDGVIPLLQEFKSFDRFLNDYPVKQATGIAKFMTYLQEMYGGQPDVNMINDITSSSINDFKSAFRSSENYKNDQNVYDNFYKHQDLSALEAAFMHVERESAIFYIDQLKRRYKKVNSGTAKMAIKFMETIYKTSDIRGTNPLSRAELKELNIINDR